jgi:hypothetical protein
LNHERADVLLEVIPDGYMFQDEKEDEEQRKKNYYDTALCLVCIRPNRNELLSLEGDDEKKKQHHSVWFWWELSRTVDDNDEDNENEERWMVDCIIPDFEDLDFETDSLSIDEFGEGDDDDDDELTIYWDV